MSVYKTIITQEKCDLEILKNECKDEIINYLLASRSHSRQQKIELYNSSMFNIHNVLNKINKENDIIANELKELLIRPNFCKNIKNSILFTLIKK
jgi:hypothetical protein